MYQRWLICSRLSKDIASYQQLGYNSRNLSWSHEPKQQSSLIGREQREKVRGKPSHIMWIMRGSLLLVQIISCLARGSRLLLKPNWLMRGCMSCTQFQQISLTSGCFLQGGELGDKWKDWSAVPNRLQPGRTRKVDITKPPLFGRFLTQLNNLCRPMSAWPGGKCQGIPLGTPVTFTAEVFLLP